ncbi:MAG: TonB-dependent receptor [Gemmatimonadales bacterium]|nr:TonB-dependent receptor [Gemmatimonadales bacterium]MDZ4388839.1 TonB-dependent receptor [Gemmatimonadales bacterium]
MTGGMVRWGLIAALLSAVPTLAAAQDGTGRIIGKVVDGEGRVPIGGARISVVGTTLRATTAVDGRFSIRDVPADTITLRVTMIGYAPTTVTGVVVLAGEVIEQDIALSGLAVELQELTITAAAAQGSVDAALDEQRNSVAIVNAISAEQIARSSDGDAASAVQRVSGATVQDGKYVFVRGLGDRYTTASLNGARIPSPEPERKVVPLDLFPSSLLSGITTSKTFTPDQSGDFAGASVNIKTREFSGERFLAFSASSGYNDAVTGKFHISAPRSDRDWLALGAGSRSLPTPVRTTDFSQSLPSSEANALVRSFRNRWSPIARDGLANGGFGATLGGNLPTGGTGISYLVSGTYSTTQEIRSNQQRSLAAALQGAEAEEIDRFEGSTGRNSVLWGGIANLSTTLGSHTKLSLNNTYNRTMDNEGRRETGFSENLAIPLRIERLRYVERNVRSSQLALLHTLGGGRHTIEWGVTSSGVTRQEPDRSEIVYSIDEQGRATWFGFSNEAAVRTFADLDEDAFEANANWQVALGAIGSGASLRFGGLHRRVDRDATNQSFSISLTRPLPEDAAEAAPEEIFDGRFTGVDDSFFRVVPLAAGGSYTASDRLTAGYAMISLPISSRLDLIGGARFERSTVEVRSLSSAGEPSLADPEFNDILPSLALTWRLNDNMNIRASATQTLSRPEYRELSPILFREVIGFDNVRGNADLQRALIRNYDIRWEFYPGRGELLSIGLFAKDFDNPIERIYQGTSGTRIITFVNARGANNYGVELEGRKSLSFVAPSLQSLSIFTNATFMKSEIQIDPASGSVTNSERKMVGQAPYVINAGLGWTHPTSEASATVLFNRVGERITDAGELPLPDVVEKPRNVLDLSLRLPIFSMMSARIDAKNILDAPYKIMQGSVVRERYLAGRVFNVGFTWRQ